jgi:hypothetical protein
MQGGVDRERGKTGRLTNDLVAGSAVGMIGFGKAALSLLIE